MNPCGCRDCMELSAGQPGSLCWECEDAGCEIYPSTALVTGAIEYAGASHMYDCQKEDAYERQ